MPHSQHQGLKFADSVKGHSVDILGSQYRLDTVQVVALGFLQINVQHLKHNILLLHLVFKKECHSVKVITVIFAAASTLDTLGNQYR